MQTAGQEGESLGGVNRERETSSRLAQPDLCCVT